MPIRGAPGTGINTIRNPLSPLAPDSPGRVRVSQQFAEVIHDGDNNKVRVSQQFAEVIHSGGDNRVRVSAQFLEVIHVYADFLTPSSSFNDAESFFSPTVMTSVTLSPSLYSDTDTFYSALVAAGQVSLLPGLLTDADAFSIPTVAPGPVTLLPGIVTDADSIYSSTIAVGPVTLTPSLFSDADTFYSGIVSGGQAIAPGLLVDGDTLFAPTLTAGAVTLLPGIASDADSIYSSTLTAGAVTLAPSLYSDVEAFFTSSVSATYALTPALFTDVDSFFTPIADSHWSILPALVTDVDVAAAPTVQPGAVSLLAGITTDADAFFAPSLLSTYHLAPSALASDDVAFSPVVAPGAITLLPGIVSEDAIVALPNVQGTTVLSAPFVTSETIIYVPVDASLYYVFPPLFNEADSFFVANVHSSLVTIQPALYVDAEIFWPPFTNNQKKNGQGGGSTGGTVTSDLKYASQITMSESGLIVTLEATASAAKIINTRMLIYSDVGGLPSALLGQTTVKSSVVVGANDYPLLVPVSVLAGQKIWVALHSDGNFNWFLSNSPGGSKYNTDLFSDGPSNPFGPVSNDNKKAPVFVLYLSAANAALSPNLVADIDAFYAPSQGNSHFMLPGALLDADFTYPTVVRGGSELLPTFYSDNDSFFQPNVAKGAVTLLPPLWTDAEIVFSPDIGADHGVAFSAAVGSDDVIYQATVTPMGANLLPTLLNDADIFLPPELRGENDLTADLDEDIDSFAVPLVSAGTVTLAPSMLITVDDFFSPALAQFLGTRSLLPGLVTDLDLIDATSRLAPQAYRRQVNVRGREDSAKAISGKISPAVESD